MKKTLLGHYFQYFLITMMILMGAYFYVYDRLQEVMYRQVRADLQETALLLQPVLPPLDTGSREIDEFCKETAGKTSLRLTIIMPDGLVVGDSDNYIGMLGNHADRPEVIEALRGKNGFSRRYSDTMDIRFAYLAVPLKKEGNVIAVMRVAKPVEVIDTVFSALRVRILLLILIIILASGIFGFYVSKKTKSALLKMEHAARRIHSGDYSVKVDMDFPGEAQALAVEMNRMAGELQRRILEITTQKSELEAILTGMLEAVILLGTDLRIQRMNQAASRLLEISPDEAKGRDLISVFRSSALHTFTSALRTGSGPQETSITFSIGGEELYLQVYGMRIKPRPGSSAETRDGDIDDNDAILLVLNDVTRIKNLENIRKDFVANVSHELKTPITSITGFVETLLAGAMEEPKEARHFLEIIQRHSIRLNTIIDDLLSLSRLEQPDKNDLEFEAYGILGIVSGAVQICRQKAEKRGIRIDQEVEKEYMVFGIPRLVEQALVNIIDNAVKYSEPETTISISVRESDRFVELLVEDQGQGIPPEDLPRIFERFYRVDKARSREMGGTGLGLAITKHIIRLNRGEIRVESTPGEGTSFFILLPKFLSEQHL